MLTSIRHYNLNSTVEILWFKKKLVYLQELGCDFKKGNLSVPLLVYELDEQNLYK